MRACICRMQRGVGRALGGKGEDVENSAIQKDSQKNEKKVTEHRVGSAEGAEDGVICLRGSRV